MAECTNESLNQPIPDIKAFIKWFDVEGEE